VPAAKTEDVRELARFGYRQELDRSLGSFSSFAAGFSYISILTGVFQMFYLGFAAGGPAFVWTWPVVFLGQFSVALGFAELAAHYPLSGGVYQWSKRIGWRGLGWMAGWVYLACAVISLASVALALQATLPQLAPAFQVIGDSTIAADRARNAVLLGCVLIGLTTVINAVGVRLLARINNAGVFVWASHC
jgi:amino acid transporter